MTYDVMTSLRVNLPEVSHSNIRHHNEFDDIVEVSVKALNSSKMLQKYVD